MSDLTTILAGYGVTVIPLRATRGPRQTHAGRTLEKMLERHGEAHLHNVMLVLIESENNRHALVAPVISAVSLVLLAHPTWFERDASRFLGVIDRLNLMVLHEQTKENRKAVPPKYAIADRVFEHLAVAFGKRVPNLNDIMGET